MAHIWKFSPQSEELLQRCIAIAPPEDENNKWVRAFRKKTQIEIKPNSTSVDEKIESDSQLLTSEPEIVIDSDNYEQFFESLGTGSDLDIEFLQKECREHPKLLSLIAHRLPAPSLEKIADYVFFTKNTDDAFVKNFVKHSLPIILMKDYKRFYLDLIKLIMNKYSDIFTDLLEVIVKNENVSTNILSDLTTNINGGEKEVFLRAFLKIEFASIDFIRHLQTINSFYATCEKNDNLQKYIFDCLYRSKELCKENKKYGKLLVSYLQNVKNMKSDAYKKEIQEIVEKHSSPFSKQCLLLFNQINRQDREL